MMRPCLLAASLVLLPGCQPVLQKLSGSEPPKVTALSAAALTGPVLQVEIASRGANAPLSRVAMNGDVETWLAVDNISVSLRQGVLVASRGLGFDLMGADAQGTLDALAGYDGGVYRRQMRYLTGEQHSTYLMAGCSMAAIGPEMVDGQRLRRFEE
nr:YjbF family lipoprotein [Paracoccaceae bacterium]